jgi:hypothetical protein
MSTYKAVAKDGRTTFICAYSYSDAFEQATGFYGTTVLESLNEV